MNRTAKISIFSLLTVLLLLWAGYFLGHMLSVQDALIRQVAGYAMHHTRFDLLEKNRLSVVLCGTGTPAPDRERASACTAVFAGGHFFLVDVGPSSARNVGLFHLPSAALSGILLTHFHSDHIGDLGEINTQSWMAGRNNPLPVYGPPGVERVVEGFVQAYALDRGYRAAGVAALLPQAWAMEPHAVEITGSARATGAAEAATVLDRDGLTITAFTVDHAPVTPAYGYRFDYKGRSIVISGDTAMSPNLIQAAGGADLLIHEALAKHMIRIIQEVAEAQHDALIAETLGSIQRYHTTPVEAAEAANQAHVKLLVMSHAAPPQFNFLGRWVFMRDVSETRSRGVQLGYDGMSITLPVGSSEIRVGGVD
jgi:ribonuclease Z